ncbi:MAG: hypothetical protein AB7E78_14655 [Porticoccaceae bacterium]
MNTSSNTVWNWPRKPLAAAIAATLLAQAPLAGAAIFKELSAEELGEMRGKFVVGHQVQYFGMSVTTSWTSPAAVVDTASHARTTTGSHASTTTTTTTTLSAPGAGYVAVGGGQSAQSASPAVAAPPVTHTASLDLKVDNSGPETRVSYQVGGTLGEPVSNVPAPTPNAALAQIDGAVQAIQVSGSDNVVKNNVGYAVIPAGAAPVLDDAQVASALPAGQTFQNGDMVTQFATSDGVGFTITSQGNQVTQRLGMNPVTNHNQLLQVVQLEGDGHRIVNDLMLQVAFDNAVSQSGGLRFRADRVMNLL